jgi:DNA-binding CsgD family transcriptional regulator
LVTLPDGDLELLSRAIRLLVSPLEHPTLDDWRRAVNRELKSLLRADSVGFLFPTTEGAMMFSEEHDPSVLNGFPELLPPPLSDGTPIWERMTLLGVARLSDGYGPDYHRYLESAYYREYAAANGAHDTLCAITELGGLCSPRSVASLHFWRARPEGPQFGEREVTLLRLVFPAFTAGVATQLRWGLHRGDLLSTLDSLGQAVLVFDASGNALHQTPAFAELLRDEPKASTIRDDAVEAMHCVRKSLAETRAGKPGHEAPCVMRGIRTTEGRYLVRASLHGRAVERAPLIFVSVERLVPVVRTEAELRDAFGLTRAELRVATLISQGLSNSRIARDLSISEHTARRHTERILRKMGASARSQVAAKLIY